MVGKLRETTASAAAANWRDAHLQMLKGIGKGGNRGPKTKHIMTKIMLNMNVKSLIGVVSFRYSLLLTLSIDVFEVQNCKIFFRILKSHRIWMFPL